MIFKKWSKGHYDIIISIKQIYPYAWFTVSKISHRDRIYAKSLKHIISPWLTGVSCFTSILKTYILISTQEYKLKRHKSDSISFPFRAYIQNNNKLTSVSHAWMKSLYFVVSIWTTYFAFDISSTTRTWS